MRRQLGSISAIGKNYYKVMVSAGINPATGRPVRKVKNVRGSRREAERVLNAMLVEVGRGDDVRADLTLDSYWRDIYLPAAEGRVRERTLEGYKSNYDSMLFRDLGGLKLTQITPPVINRWLGTLSSDRRRFDGRRMLRMILRSAVRDGLIDKDPTDSVPTPKYRKYRPSILTAEQAAAYVKHSYGTDVEPLILVTLGLGLRREEFVPLDWEDITSDGDVTIDSAITAMGKRLFEGDTKTAWSERVVRLPPSFINRLNEIRGTGPLMKQPDGSRLDPERIGRRYKAWQATLPDGIPRILLKDLRHTSLTLTLESGADLLTVSRRAGHSSTSITAAYYLRPHKNIDEAAASGLDDLLSSG